jgi:hypothetical protein
MDAVRSADAPGTSAPSPLGLRNSEFIQLVKYAASLANTKIIEFSEVNPKYDSDNRTSKLVAIAMHRFAAAFLDHASHFFELTYIIEQIAAVRRSILLRWRCHRYAQPLNSYPKISITAHLLVQHQNAKAASFT